MPDLGSPPGSTVSTGGPGDAGSTQYAQQQNAVLHKTLGRFDIIFIVVSAVVGLEMLGSVSAQGAETFTWLVFLIIVFLVPYALIFAETGSAFVGEGGVYLWVRKAFGRPAAAIASAFTWITQPVWVGGSMAFLNAEAAREHLVPFEAGSAADYAFKILFIWLTVLAAVLSLRRAKWIPHHGCGLQDRVPADLRAHRRGLRDRARHPGPPP